MWPTWLSRNILLCALVLTAFILGATAVYLSPLKYNQLIEPKIRDVKAQEIYEEMKKNPAKYDFIDVRGAAQYADLHAEGSRNVPLHTMYFEREKLPKGGKKLVLICSGGVASGVAYMYLEHFGFRNVVRVDGGIESWQLAGLPIVSAIK